MVAPGLFGEPGHYEDATFSLSTDPSSVVLFVQGIATISNVTHAMRLFGDGRLEITVSGRTPTPLRREVFLDDAAKNELVEVAIRHGLAEWDTARIESEMAIELHGDQLATEDGYAVSVILSLATYRNGNVEKENLVKKLTVGSPNIAARYFPSIVEFQGVSILQRRLADELAAEGLLP